MLVPPDDAAALAEATLALLDDPLRRARVSASARLSARRFSWDEVASDHLGFLERMAAGNTAAPVASSPALAGHGDGVVGGLDGEAHGRVHHPEDA